MSDLTSSVVSSSDTLVHVVLINNFPLETEMDPSSYLIDVIFHYWSLLLAIVQVIFPDCHIALNITNAISLVYNHVGFRKTVPLALTGTSTVGGTDFHCFRRLTIGTSH